MLSDDNETIVLTFTEPVYGNSDATGALTSDDISIVANGDVTASYSVDHTAGSKTATINLTISSSIAPTVTFTITPASGSSIYDDEGEPMASTDEVTTNTATQIGIIGKWLSEGDNVAPLLVNYFSVEKVYATFNANKTYEVNQFNVGNETTTPDLTYSGTYTMTESGTGNIWTIVCNQEVPFAAEASGIFEIVADPEVLWYEVVQTTGTQNVPPTPEAGFGSSNNGSLGTLNIQKYVRID
ncbi:MAG: hypothetical protein R2771_09135 [Saprospiraceae bacterium]